MNDILISAKKDITKKIQSDLDNIYFRLLNKLNASRPLLSVERFSELDEEFVSPYLMDMKYMFEDMLKPALLSCGIPENRYSTFWMHVLVLFPKINYERPTESIKNRLQKLTVQVPVIDNTKCERQGFSLRCKICKIISYRCPETTKRQTPTSIDVTSRNNKLREIVDERKQDVLSNIEGNIPSIMNVINRELDDFIKSEMLL